MNFSPPGQSHRIHCTLGTAASELKDCDGAIYDVLDKPRPCDRFTDTEGVIICSFTWNGDDSVTAATIAQRQGLVVCGSACEEGAVAYVSTVATRLEMSPGLPLSRAAEREPPALATSLCIDDCRCTMGVHSFPCNSGPPRLVPRTSRCNCDSLCTPARRKFPNEFLSTWAITPNSLYTRHRC